MADKRPKSEKPKGAEQPNRINRLLKKKSQTDYASLTNMVVLTNLNVNNEQNLEIRTDLRGKKMRIKMVRSRLTMKAFEELGLKDAQKLFLGPTLIVDADDPVTCAKVANDMVVKYKDALKIAGGVLEGKLLTAAEVVALAKSKTKPELLAEVAGLSRGPGGRVAAALKGPGGRIAGAIKALVTKLEKSEAKSA
jgi:large subunit ribosomal protein L10